MARQAPRHPCAVLPLSGRGRRLPRRERPGTACGRHGTWQDPASDRGGGLASAPQWRRACPRRLPRIAQAAVVARDLEVHRIPGAGGAGRPRNAAHPVPNRRHVHRRQLRAGAAGPHDYQRSTGARLTHPRRGAAHQELANQDRGQHQARGDALRVRAHGDSAREPARGPLQHHAG